MSKKFLSVFLVFLILCFNVFATEDHKYVVSFDSAIPKFSIVKVFNSEGRLVYSGSVLATPNLVLSKDRYKFLFTEAEGTSYIYEAYVNNDMVISLNDIKEPNNDELNMVSAVTLLTVGRIIGLISMIVQQIISLSG